MFANPGSHPVDPFLILMLGIAIGLLIALFLSNHILNRK